MISGAVSVPIVGGTSTLLSKIIVPVFHVGTSGYDCFAVDRVEKRPFTHSRAKHGNDL